MPPVSATAVGRLTLLGRRGVVRALGGLVRGGSGGLLVGAGLFGAALLGATLFGAALHVGAAVVERTGLDCVLARKRRPVHEDVLGEVDRRRRGILAGTGLHGHPLVDALQRKRQAPALRIDLEDAHVHRVALGDDLARVLDVVLCELADVDEPFDARQDLDERAERDDLRHLAGDDVALVIALEHLLPRIGLRLLESERDALTLAIDVENLDLDLLADLEHLGRMVDVAPRQLADVDQPVHPVEIDERAEVDDVRDRPGDDVAGVEAVEDALAVGLALLLEHRAARQHDVVARAVQLDDLAAQLLRQELVEILDAANVDERRGQEPTHAEVEDEAALDDLDHAAVDRLALLVGRLDRLPGDLEPGALLREDQPTFGVLLRHHERGDLVADADLVRRIHRAADRELADGDDAFRLVTDVDEDLVLVDANDGAVHDLSLVDRREGRLVVGNEFAGLGVCCPDSLFQPRVVDCLVSHRAGEYSPGGSDARLPTSLGPTVRFRP